MAATPHALIFPYPAQSHIISLLELSYRLLDCGFEVTFLNTEFNHTRLLSALPEDHATIAATLKIVDGIHLASIPDGLGPTEDRNDHERLTKSITSFMPGYLEEIMMSQVRDSIEDRFTCFVADVTMGWAVDIAKKSGLRSVAYFPAAAAVLVQILSIPKLIKNNVIDEKGAPKQQGMFILSPEMSPMDPSQIFWNCNKDSKLNNVFFDYMNYVNKSITNADLILCNTSYELEKSIFTYAPNILPIGPLLTGSRPNKIFGNFWMQDTKCIDWLDTHKKNTVIYVAFGSFTMFDKYQFQELAMGLELAVHPFLWVVRPDIISKDNNLLMNLSSLIERVGDRGRIVDWCPQPQVLAHASIACFISHCGWNSTLEGIRNGVPFLCWPYFVDQFFNQNYICDVWKIGLRIMDDEKTINSKEEIISKLEKLIGDMEIRERSLTLKEMTWKSLKKGGSSLINFNIFVDTMMGV